MPRILLAAHGGASAEGATRLAPLVAERLAAELAVVSVLPVPQPMDYGFGVVYAADDAEEAELARRLGEELQAQFSRCGVVGREPEIRRGQAGVEIATAARAMGASLIIVGLGPHHAVDRALGGETALQLVQVASTPILALPAGAAELPRRAVAAIDFTPSSVRAAETAAGLLAAGDTLHLVHVRTREDATRASPALAEARESAEARLAALAAVLVVPEGVKVERRVVDGAPARALLDEVRRVEGDLIALGSHGYGLWKRLTIGSVASKVVRLATTAVLVQPIGSVTGPAAAAGGA